MADYIFMCRGPNNDFSKGPLVYEAIIALSVHQSPAVAHAPQNNISCDASADPYTRRPFATRAIEHYGTRTALDLDTATIEQVLALMSDANESIRADRPSPGFSVHMVQNCRHFRSIGRFDLMLFESFLF
jgi:hypothetical protein